MVRELTCFVVMQYPKLGTGCVSFLLMEVCCSWILQLCTLTNEWRSHEWGMWTTTPGYTIWKVMLKLSRILKARHLHRRTWSCLLNFTSSLVFDNLIHTIRYQIQSFDVDKLKILAFKSIKVDNRYNSFLNSSHLENRERGVLIKLLKTQEIIMVCSLISPKYYLELYGYSSGRFLNYDDLVLNRKKTRFLGKRYFHRCGSQEEDAVTEALRCRSLEQ